MSGQIATNVILLDFLRFIQQLSFNLPGPYCMFKKSLPLVVGCLAATALISGCSSSNSDDPVADPATAEPAADSQTPAPDTAPEPTAGNAGVLFPELQGSWSAGCQFFDEEEPSEGYANTVITVTGNDFQTNTLVYSDSNCVTPLPRGFLQFGDDFQSYGTIERPEGSADTSVGAVPFINMNYDRYTIENQPLIASAAALFQPYTDYSIVYVDGDQMYLGDLDIPGQDGESAETRAITLDFEEPLLRQ